MYPNSVLLVALNAVPRRLLIGAVIKDGTKKDGKTLQFQTTIPGLKLLLAPFSWQKGRVRELEMN